MREECDFAITFKFRHDVSIENTVDDASHTDHIDYLDDEMSTRDAINQKNQ